MAWDIHEQVCCSGNPALLSVLHRLRLWSPMYLCNLWPAKTPALWQVTALLESGSMSLCCKPWWHDLQGRSHLRARVLHCGPVERRHDAHTGVRWSV